MLTSRGVVVAWRGVLRRVGLLPRRRDAGRTPPRRPRPPPGPPGLWMDGGSAAWTWHEYAVFLLLAAALPAAAAYALAVDAPKVAALLPRYLRPGKQRKARQ